MGGECLEEEDMTSITQIETLSVPSSFSPSIGQSENDCRFVYCAFAISDMLSDWSAIDVDAAVDFLLKSRVSFYEI